MLHKSQFYDSFDFAGAASLKHHPKGLLFNTFLQLFHIMLSINLYIIISSRMVLNNIDSLKVVSLHMKSYNALAICGNPELQ